MVLSSKSGTFPSEIGNLKNLELLGLDDNDFFGNIEMFHPLSELRSLYIEGNYFSGTISDALMASFPKLQELDMSDCNITGELPLEFFNHQNGLKVIDLHGNNLKGELPDKIDRNANLEFLALHENKFTGRVKESLTNFTVLKHLDISLNGLSSTLPQKMELMTSLEYLFTATNNFQEGEVRMNSQVSEARSNRFI